MNSPNDQFFYGHGKLLLTGEYFVLDGALALALPSHLGQSLSVRYQRSEAPKLNWKSFDKKNNCWFEADFELWRFDLLNTETSKEIETLQQILRQVRIQNPHFLRGPQSVYVETRIEFPLTWGLGSSSTLLYNIAQWAYVSPFELAKNTLGGSGYDIACAESIAPIFYQKTNDTPEWKDANFNPPFADNLYFVYLNQKQDTQREVAKFKEKLVPGKVEILKELSEISKALVEIDHLRSFETLIKRHEEIISQALDLPKVKDTHFSDYFGEVKSLGAWGGDFCLATSDRPRAEVEQYFSLKGFSNVIPYKELIKAPNKYPNIYEESSFVELEF